MYSKFRKDYKLVNCLYVDDMLIFSTNVYGIEGTK